jgi:hypothetical protein
MILDKEVLFGDAAAYNAGVEIDLDTVRPGPGKPIKCFFTTLTTLTNCTAIAVLDAPHTVPDEALITIEAVPAAGETIEFDLPSDTQQFVALSLTAATAGTFTSGVVLEGVQTNL